MSSSTPGPSTRTTIHDYTEGATATDIEAALANSRRSRRDSQSTQDVSGSMFDGPGHTIVPSSVSRMSTLDRGMRDRHSREWSRSRRRSSANTEGHESPRVSRRISSESQAVESDYLLSDEEHSGPVPSSSSMRGRKTQQRPLRSPSLHKTGVLENIANIFSRSTVQDDRRSLTSRRSSMHSRRSRSRSDAGSRRSATASDDEDGDERWGYSSGEEDDSGSDLDAVHTMARDDDGASFSASELDYNSNPPSPKASLPLLSTDPIFGNEARIDMEGMPLGPSEPPPPGPPSRQNIFIADEDTTVLLVGFETIRIRQYLWYLGCVLSFGVLALLGHWFPRFWLRWVAKEKAFKHLDHGFIVVETAYRDVSLFPLRILKYPYHISTVFPPPPIEERLSRRPSLSSLSKPNNDAQFDPDFLEELRVVDYRYSRFALDPRTGLFNMISDWRDPSWIGVSSVQNGLDASVQEQRRIIFGANEINIEGKSITALLVDEVIHPFYVFQIASIVLWSLDDYYYYAFCIFLISAASIITTLVETRKTINRMREMSRFSCPVNVFSEGAWHERTSETLVPGDMVNLSSSSLSTIPADMFLLSGDAIVNESMLTGESVPVAKIPVADGNLARWKDAKDVDSEAAKSFLYSGTHVIRIRGSFGSDAIQGRPALALVTRIGFNTTKGALVRSMLFPRPIGFKFYRDSMRFIGVLAGIAGLGFCVSAVQFVRLGIPWHTILIRALDLITVVVPPALPATLSIGTSFAISRLRKNGIYCISPSRVNVGGKINVCCFDKTGTLTEDGLDILGVRGLDRYAHQFGELLEDVHDMPSESLGGSKASFLHALATCHSLKMVDGEVIGDPLDVKMFGFTKWTLEEGLVAGTGKIKSKGGEERPAALVQTVVRPPGSASFRVEDALKGGTRHAHFLELGVIRTFEFVSSLRRMSVVVKRLRSSSMEVYVKGAPEVMQEICDKATFPEDYDDLLSYYTKRGYRVIAIAGKSIEGMSWLKAQRMKREQAESGLRFLGLIIFENKLKPGTAPAIQALRAAHLACRMITGDNALTAVSVARECGLITQGAHVFAPAFTQGNSMTPRSKVEWTCMDETSWKLDSYSLKPLAPPPHHTVSADELDYHDYALVVTGDVFRWMINYAPLETLQRMLVKAQIFARMSPDEKNEIVERLQALGYTVLMCGDGANDCAALKAADVGISLSEAEASVAAPFTSSTPDIGCVLEVIRESRAALVTSFSCFKYMALYSLIQFTTITLLYSFASSLGDFQFLYIDLFIIIPVAVTMGRTLPYPRIYTKRPTASLVSKKVLASIVGQIVVTSAVQLWAFLWVRDQEWYSPPVLNPDTDDNHLSALNYENSALFLVSCFQYILIAAVFSIGPPYRKPIWTNGWLMLSLVTLTAFNILVLLRPPQAVTDILELMSLPSSGRFTLLAAAAANVILSIAFERWGAPSVARVIGWVLRSRRNSRGRVREGKIYKAVEGGMR